MKTIDDKAGTLLEQTGLSEAFHNGRKKRKKKRKKSRYEQMAKLQALLDHPSDG